MGYKVFKFGGASVANSERIKNVEKILSAYSRDKILIVVSALGKTTNALEQVVNAYIRGTDDLRSLVEKVKLPHFTIMDELFEKGHSIYDDINDQIVELEWIIEDEVKDNYDYIYDQIVSLGELLSTRILNAYLKQCGHPSVFLDARDCIITDETFREAQVNWQQTESRIKEMVIPALEKSNWIITQGFIGSTDQNQTTTLGREGSDFSASVFSYALDAETMCIWKDVPGVLTADPRFFDQTIKIDRLSYKEAIEMTYYGAKVIHPKTIKPIQNKSIPLYVKSFIDPEGGGTVISDDIALTYPPVVVVSTDQALIHFSTRDFSFVTESHLSQLFSLFKKYRIKLNMMRNTAISFTICTKYLPDRINPLLDRIENEYKIMIDKNLELITIRHFNDATVEELVQNKIVLFEERLRDTIQMVVREVPTLKRR